ncbi:Nn.00g007420.m01.CDS01 [Neocucurbitaria sp. VM-36]
MSGSQGPLQEMTPTPDLNPVFDPKGCIVCEGCTKRYVEPDDVYKVQPKKGQKHTKCKLCRKAVKKDEFPAYLNVPKALKKVPPAYQNASATKVEQGSVNESSSTLDLREQWLASLTPERESVLLHGQPMLKQFSAQSTLADLPRAGSDIQWQDIIGGLRDIHSLERVFQGFDTLRGHYTMGINTVAAIGFLAVSLNNSAVRKNSPFKFCWLDIPFRNGTAALFMSLGARSSSEKACWADASAEQRLKACSVWETDIRKSAQAISIPYNSTNNCTFGPDDKALISPNLRNCLLWVHSTYDLTVKGPGTLLFPDGERLVIKNQCSDSEELLAILINHLHQQGAKQAWKGLQQTAVDTLHDIRAPSSVARAACKEIIIRKRQRA